MTDVTKEKEKATFTQELINDFLGVLDILWWNIVASYGHNKGQVKREWSGTSSQETIKRYILKLK